MYMLVLDWFDFDYEEHNNKIHAIPVMDAGDALRMAHYIAYTKAGFEKYDMPKNIYLYEIEYVDRLVGFDPDDEAYHGYCDEDCFLASWTDVDKNVHYKQ